MRFTRLVMFFVTVVSTAITINAAIPPSGQPADVEKEIRRLNREWGEAVVRRDMETLKRLLSDDYTLIQPSGQVINKAQELEEVKALVSSFKLKSYKIEDVSVRVKGERANVTGHAVLKGTLDGQDFTRRYWFTRTFEKRRRFTKLRGRWRIIAAQMIEMPQEGKRNTYPQKMASIISLCSPTTARS